MFRFRPITPRRWAGHYERIPGETTTFHVSATDQVSIVWNDLHSGDRLKSPARTSEAVQKLGAAINKVKWQYGNYSGGSFVINEFGQVIVPIRASWERYLVGMVAGSLAFRNPDGDRTYFTLDPPEGLRSGQAWHHPYVGMPFHLANSGSIYRILDDQGDRRCDFLDFRDIPVIRQLRRIRGRRGCRFIVNYRGAVLTKYPYQGLWIPVYVGKLDYTCWYPQTQIGEVYATKVRG